MAAGSSLLSIREATKKSDVEVARKLFQEYADSFESRLCFQGFDEELAGLPGEYARPGGRLLLAFQGPAAAGCVALRPLEQGTCEMKRLFVRPAYRNSGVGRVLVDRIIQEAGTCGYRRMRLDSLPHMKPALQLYRRLGFEPIAPYTMNPIPGAVFLELQLERTHR
jgi:GNAT superfamily N-acetyltransferase